jgi:Zn-dependent metalloprotease
MSCNGHCFIIPHDVLKRLADDLELSAEQRKNFANGARMDAEVRKLRAQAGKLARLSVSFGLAPVHVPAAPTITVADCHHGQSLPGSPVVDPSKSPDATVQRAFDETKAVAEFYQKVFGRNSIDNLGMTMESSVHYGVDYNNAFWNGSRMTYGDGDGNIFIDFTASNDVICHELTHGVTQFSAQLEYSGEAGGLNEGMSDVFGCMVRQWQAEQDVAEADWLIGKDIMGPGAIQRGYTCLRSLASPGDAHCLAPQPFHIKDFKPGMDPHYSSGIPNHAFYTMAMAVGGNCWDKVGQIWYKALTGYKPSPRMKMKTLADRTRSIAASMYPADAAVKKAVDAGWAAVGL